METYHAGNRPTSQLTGIDFNKARRQDELIRELMAESIEAAAAELSEPTLGEAPNPFKSNGQDRYEQYLRAHDARVDRARAVKLEDVLSQRGIIQTLTGKNGKLEGPCPKCGGTDRFGVNCSKPAFLCRHCFPKDGGDAISLVMWLDGCEFLSAVEALTGEEEPNYKPRIFDKFSDKFSDGCGGLDFDKAAPQRHREKPQPSKPEPQPDEQPAPRA
jgi:hypothetical protein